MTSDRESSMSRRVILMRHAKSDWNDSSLSDHQRPLNARGKKDAPRMATKLSELGWQPSRVLTSDSQRTIETLDLMKGEFGELSTERLTELYHPSVETLFTCMDSSQSEETLMVLAHNPATELAVYQLTGEFHPMPTAACALFIEQGDTWTCQQVLRPKELFGKAEDS